MNTPRTAALVTSTISSTLSASTVVAPEEAARFLKVPEGFFVIECRYGTRSFARLTGRTVQRFGMACPTVERYEVETTVVDGAIWGVLGAKRTGTFFVRPDAF